MLKDFTPIQKKILILALILGSILIAIIYSLTSNLLLTFGIPDLLIVLLIKYFYRKNESNNSTTLSETKTK